MIVKLVASLLLGYLLGSIPFGILIIKMKRGVDIRKYGSGKMGGTNVMRVAGVKTAIFVAALDVSKGALAIFISRLIIGSEPIFFGGTGFTALGVQIMAGIAAMTGHVWPVFAGFKGGRGVATFFGALAALCPMVAIFGGEVLIVGAGLSSFASLGSIIGVLSTSAVLIPLTMSNGFQSELLIYSLIGAILIIILHRDNIVRLASGTERRLFERIPTSNKSRWS